MRILRDTRPLFALCFFLVLVGGCAAAGTASGGSSSMGTVTRAELADMQNIDALQALRSLRPNWLNYRGGAPQVLLDGLRRGGVDTLRQILVQDIAEIDFLPPREATNRFGTGFPYGAIAVRSR